MMSLQAGYYSIITLCVTLCLCLGSAARADSWKLEQKSEEMIDGRHVLRFEHDCLKNWGYTQKSKQYFYVVEPKLQGNGPLMVCLHSAGADPDKFQIGKNEMPGNVSKVAEAGDDFTGLILNSGIDSDWWWGAEEIKHSPDKYKQQLTAVENRVLATIEWAVRKYNIDRNRIYMRGTSMGGSGTLGIGMSHGDIFAALWAGVPAGTEHAIYRISNSDNVKKRIGTRDDVPPVLTFFSQKDGWSKGTENSLNMAHQDKLAIICAWGPWGHINHYEMTNPAAYEYPWLSIRRNQAYPAFTNASSDDHYPGLMSDDPAQDGQINAYFRWNVLNDTPDEFTIELRLVQSRELNTAIDIPTEVTADVTPRRLQHFQVKAGKAYTWKIEQSGKLLSSGTVTADDRALLTVPKIKITAKPMLLHITSH